MLYSWQAFEMLSAKIKALDQLDPKVEDVFGKVLGLAEEVSQAESAARYLLGEMTNLIERRYGESNVQKFASQIGTGIKYKTLMQYGAVVRFYGLDLCGHYLEQGLHYSHLRTARAVADLDTAVSWLDRAVADGLSVGALQVLIFGSEDDRDEDSSHNPEPRVTVIDYDRVKVNGWDYRAGTVTLQLGDAAERFKGLIGAYVAVKVTIADVGEEIEAV